MKNLYQLPYSGVSEKSAVSFLTESFLAAFLILFSFLGLGGKLRQILGVENCCQPHFRIPTSQNDIQRVQASIAIL